MPVKYLSDNNIDGVSVGQSAADKISFYGATPIAKPATTSQSAVATTTITSVGSTSLTALDVTRINALIDRVEAIRVLQDETRTNLIALGLQKGSI